MAIEVMWLMGLRAILAGVVALEPQLQFKVPNRPGFSSRVAWVVECQKGLHSESIWRGKAAGKGKGSPLSFQTSEESSGS
jgi:hypothetical protein